MQNSNSTQFPAVFLGGTCNGSLWRDQLVPMLEVTSFNPVVADWNDEVQQREIAMRAGCEWCLYVITPKMTGVYSIAEVVEDACKRPEKTLFCFLTEDDGDAFGPHQIKSLKATSALIARCGAKVYDSLEAVAHFVNQNSVSE